MNYPYAIQQKKSGVCPIFLLILHFKTQYDMTHRPLYIIPARGGSKGIPRKNIRPLAGRPLIAYSIDVATSLCDDLRRIILSTDDAGFLAGVQDGTIAAGVSGTWNAVAVEEAWGSGFGAAKLPSYTCAGQEIPMASFSGYKLIGVNSYSRNRDWAAKLAEWITNEENQALRFRLRGQGPSNKNAAASEEVQGSPAIAALLAQSEFSQLQRVGGKFWDPVTEFAGSMAAGNPSGASLQSQLDRMVEGVTAR